VILVDDCDVDPLAQWVRTILLFAQRGTRAIVVVASSAPATPQFPDAVVVDLQPFSDKDIEEFCVVNNISPSRELIESLLALESPGRIAEALHRLGAATQEPR
jgi:hypothetical protein